MFALALPVKRISRPGRIKSESNQDNQTLQVEPIFPKTCVEKKKNQLHTKSNSANQQVSYWGNNSLNFSGKIPWHLELYRIKNKALKLAGQQKVRFGVEEYSSF